MGRQLGGDVNSRRTVRTADNTDGSRLFARETDENCHGEGDEYTQLRRRAHKHTARVGYHGTEVRHRADAHKDERREDNPFNALVQVIEDTFVGDYAGSNGYVVAGIYADVVDVVQNNALYGQTGIRSPGYGIDERLLCAFGKRAPRVGKSFQIQT